MGLENVDDCSHEGDQIKMPIGEERHRSVLIGDSTRNESRMVFYNRGLSDPGYWLYKIGLGWPSTNDIGGEGSRRCKTKRQLSQKETKD